MVRNPTHSSNCCAAAPSVATSPLVNQTVQPVEPWTGSMGRMRTETRMYRTGQSDVVLDITQDCAEFVHDAGDGLLHVFVPHATAGLAVIETGARSDDDLLMALRDLLPPDDRWRHRHGSAGHGRSHVLPAIVPPYATVPVLAGRLALGSWQSICLVDINIDNLQREVRLSFLSG